jgi:predicted glycosyltransferase
MAVEAAMLGTPSVRFSSFSGKIRVLEELEHTYKLTVGILPSEPRSYFQQSMIC